MDTTGGGANRVPILTALKANGHFGKTHLRFSTASHLTPCGIVAHPEKGDLLGHADKIAAVDCKRCDGSASWYLHTLREQREAAANLPAPAPNRIGELPHAVPEQRISEGTNCLVCGAEVFFDDTDDNGVGIWSHTETLDYFCEA